MSVSLWMITLLGSVILLTAFPTKALVESGGWDGLDASSFESGHYAAPHYQAVSVNRPSQLNWVLGVQGEWIDSAPYMGISAAAQMVRGGYYTELGFFGQRLPRDGADLPDKTRYFLSFRFGKDEAISPYVLFGLNPIEIFNASEDARLDLHGQLGMSWQLIEFWRVDFYGALHSLEHRIPYDSNQHSLDRALQPTFQRQNHFAAGIRVSLVF